MFSTVIQAIAARPRSHLKERLLVIIGRTLFRQKIAVTSYWVGGVEGNMPKAPDPSHAARSAALLCHGRRRSVGALRVNLLD